MNILRAVALYAEWILACLAYSFQTFSVLEVLGATKMNQIEVNVRDHRHGASSVVAAFEAGTSMLFQQTAAPSGWTKETTHNDKALRVVSGTASSGGATAFSSVFGSGKTAGSTALSTAQLASHAHGEIGSDGTVVYTNGGAQSGSTIGTTVGGNAALNTGSTGSGSTHNHTLSLDLHYVDCIIASAD